MEKRNNILKCGERVHEAKKFGAMTYTVI